MDRANLRVVGIKQTRLKQELDVEREANKGNIAEIEGMEKAYNEQNEIYLVRPPYFFCFGFLWIRVLIWFCWKIKDVKKHAEKIMKELAAQEKKEVQLQEKKKHSVNQHKKLKKAIQEVSPPLLFLFLLAPFLF